MTGFINQPGSMRANAHAFVEAIAERPLLSMSFGIEWMWGVLLLYSPFPLVGQEVISGEWSSGLVMAANIAIYILIAWRFRDLPLLDARQWFPGVLVAALMCGVAVCAVASASSVSADFALFLWFAGSTLMAAGMAFVNIENGRISCWLGPRKVMYHGVLAILIGSAGAFAASLLPWFGRCLLLVASPIPLVYCLYKSFDGLPRARVFKHGLDEVVHVPKRFCITSAIQGFALGSMQGMLPGFSVTFMGASVSGFCIAACLLAITAILLKWDFNTLFYRIGFPLMASGFFILDASWAVAAMGGIVLNVGYAYQYLISCCLCAYLAKSLNQPPAWVIGISTAFLLAGQLFGVVMPSIAPEGTEMAPLLVFVILASALYLLSGSNLRHGWGAIRPGLHDERADVHEEACGLIAGEYGLSDREKEIMALIAKGKTRKEISTMLSLSEETVKTHTSNLYRKLMVHSKRDCAALVHERLASYDS